MVSGFHPDPWRLYEGHRMRLHLTKISSHAKGLIALPSGNKTVVLEWGIASGSQRVQLCGPLIRAIPQITKCDTGSATLSRTRNIGERTQRFFSDPRSSGW